MTDSEKAQILDWLLTPVGSRDDRAKRIDRKIAKDDMSALFICQGWAKPEEILARIQQAMAAEQPARTRKIVPSLGEEELNRVMAQADLIVKDPEQYIASFQQDIKS